MIHHQVPELSGGDQQQQQQPISDAAQKDKQNSSFDPPGEFWDYYM
jgi:hypothetical protein